MFVVTTTSIFEENPLRTSSVNGFPILDLDKFSASGVDEFFRNEQKFVRGIDFGFPHILIHWSVIGFPLGTFLWKGRWWSAFASHRRCRMKIETMIGFMRGEISVQQRITTPSRVVHFPTMFWSKIAWSFDQNRLGGPLTRFQSCDVRLNGWICSRQMRMTGWQNGTFWIQMGRR